MTEMNKDEPGSGLLSKVARFVLHPTVNWSELDTQLPGTGTDRDRLALKAAIERKRRNDLVRKREFNMLRALLQQRSAARAQEEGAERSSALTSGEPSTNEGQKERTIEKIAQIEAQMAQHWQRKRLDAGAEGSERFHIGGTAVSRHHEGGLTAPGHLQANRPQGLAARATSFASTLPIDMLAPDSEGAASTRSPSTLPHGFAPIEEAAVRFANGDDTAAQQALRAALAKEAPAAGGLLVWHALLDYCVAHGQADAFDQLASEYASLFGVSVPTWPVWRGSASLSQRPAMTWACPMVLDAQAVQALRDALLATNGIKWLDWRALVSAEPEAARQLLELTEYWVQQPVEFRFVGASVLRRRLKASTPSGRRENDPLWWRLRLALLRQMHRQEEFDLAALDYCVSYGVLPPDWEPPKCRFQHAEGMPAAEAAVEPEAPVLAEPIKPLVTQLGGLDVVEWPAMASETQLQAPYTLPPEPEPERPVPGVASAAGTPSCRASCVATSPR